MRDGHANLNSDSENPSAFTVARSRPGVAQGPVPLSGLHSGTRAFECYGGRGPPWSTPWSSGTVSIGVARPHTKTVP